MKKIKKLLAMMMIATIAASSFVGCSSAAELEGTQNVQVSDAIVATVNGVEVKESLYRAYLWSAQQYFEQISGPSIWDIDLEGVKTQDIAKERALESITLSVVTENKAKEMGIELTKEEIDFAKEGAKNFAEVNGEILVNHQFSQADVEKLLIETGLSNKLQTQLMENYVPADEEVQKFVEENKAMFETVTAKHVLIKTVDDMNQPLPDATIQEKKALAEDILQRAKDGEDMSELAKEYTEDPGSLETGGEYTFGRGEMVEEFEQAAFDGKDGEVWPELVETVFGYHIIKTESHNPANEEEMKKAYIENEKIGFINTEFQSMIESAVVEKKEDVYNSIEIYRPEPVEQESETEFDAVEQETETEATESEEATEEETTQE